MAEHRRWYRHVWLWIVVALVVVCAAIRIAANPLASHFTQQALDQVPGYVGSFKSVSLSFIHLTYRIEGLKLVEAGQKEAAPYVYVDSATGGLVWQDLLHLHLGGSARVDHAKVTAVLPAPPSPSAKPAKKPPETPDLANVLYSLFPFRIDRVALHDDEVLVVDNTEKDVPEKSRELWVHGIEATLENVGTRRNLTKGEPTTVSLRAKIQKSGDLKVFATADPLTPNLNFAGETSLQGLKLEDLWGFLVGKTGTQPVSGSVDMYAAFKCVKGQIDAAVKPELKNVKLEAADSNLINKAKAKLADAALGLASNRVPGQNAAVAIIPLKGSVTNPKAELLPTLLTVVRNAYVEGIAGGFARVPPETAATKQGPVKQAAQAFNPKKFPKAQPQKKGQ